jgi:hypothetical protein
MEGGQQMSLVGVWYDECVRFLSAALQFGVCATSEPHGTNYRQTMGI